ncbi:centrosomal protein of 44 kDa-like [Labrus bergylta]|uniref:centrosomal protein of 44 kDa-like n=1 Tax=Labrus bergylta TaxID=56723 RepID=UPI0033142858
MAEKMILIWGNCRWRSCDEHDTFHSAKVIPAAVNEQDIWNSSSLKTLVKEGEKVPPDHATPSQPTGPGHPDQDLELLTLIPTSSASAANRPKAVCVCVCVWVLRDIFHYKPVLTKQQFLQWGFSQRKISVVCDVINFVQQKHNQLKKPRVRCPAQNKEGRPDGRGEVQPTLIAPDQPLVVNHTEYQSIFHAERFSSSSPGNMITEEEADEEEEEEEDEQEGDRLQSHSELEGRLSALEAQLQSLQPGLDRIRVLERRLEDLERRRHTDKSEGGVVIISRESWENLMSRVVLLETQSELRDTQVPHLHVSLYLY